MPLPERESPGFCHEEDVNGPTTDAVGVHPSASPNRGERKKRKTSMQADAITTAGRRLDSRRGLVPGTRAGGALHLGPRTAWQPPSW